MNNSFTIRTLVCCYGLLLLSASATELVDALPLTDRIVMLHFDEGYVRHHVRGQSRSDETVHISALDTDVASNIGSYAISSPDDQRYASPKKPIQVARKSKGTDFAWFADKWVDGRAVNDRPDHSKEHWVYLFLPEAMVAGKKYLVHVGTLATNGSDWTIHFDPAKTRSEAVHVNLLGYVPSAPGKFGYVYHWLGDKGGLDLKSYAGKKFEVINRHAQEVAFSGKLAFRKAADQQETFHKSDSPPHGNFLKADVYECDFSGLRMPGEYILAVEGIGCSFPFSISGDVYREAFRTVARGLYHNRSGIALERPWTEFTRPAPHNPKLTPGFRGKLLYSTVRFTEWGSEGGDPKELLANSRGPLDASGWYQDAGDWDSYYSHLRVPQELLLAYELAPENYTDGDLNIPESTNGIPDIIDEASWLPGFCYRLRHELLRKGYGTGGLGLRIAGDAFGSDEKKVPGSKHVGQGSWEDVDRQWVASGEDPFSTFRYAGVAAHLAHCLQLANAKSLANVDWRKEAVESYVWAHTHIRPGDEKKGSMLRDSRSYAAAALFRLTGEDQYEKQLQADMAEIQANTRLADDRQYGPFI